MSASLLDSAAPGRLMPKGEVCHLTAQSSSTLARRVKAGEFPRPIQIGPRKAAWVEAEVRKWIADRIAAGPAQIPPPARKAA